MNHKSTPKNNFTIIPNAYLYDPAIGPKEKGILTILLSKPRDWSINFKWLASVNDVGIFAIRTAVSKLETKHYIHKEVKQTGTKFAGIEYHYFDRPVTPDEFETLMTADQVHDEIRADVTPPEAYPNHQEELPLEITQDEPPQNLESKGGDVSPPPSTESKDCDIGLSDGKTRMRKTEMRETAPIINTDSKQILREQTATAPAREVDPIPQAEAPKQPPQSYPATSDINFLLDLIPERFSNPMTDALIQRSLVSHTSHQIADAIVYASDHVKGGKMQFKAYLDKCLRGGFADGYQEIREVPETTPVLSSFGAMGAGRFANGSMTGNSRTDSNLQAAAMFLQKMGVQG